VRGSLAAKFGDLGDDNLAFLRAAMTGKTSRDSGRGGLGLRLVQSAVKKSGGYFWLRSEDAAVLCTQDGNVQYFENLATIRGTQVGVDLHAPLRKSLNR
jgi:signal transduction histidine kinase